MTACCTFFHMLISSRATQCTLKREILQAQSNGSTLHPHAMFLSPFRIYQPVRLDTLFSLVIIYPMSTP